MGFIAAIVSAIAAAGSTVVSLAKTAGGAVGGVVDDIASTVGSIASDVTGTIGDAVTKGFGALEAGASDVFSAISSGVSGAAKIETEVVGPIAHFVDETTQVVTRLNDEVIEPITHTVEITYGAITNLITELHTDIHGGLKGLLEIPDAIAGALTTVDAQLGRAMQELGLANKEVVTSALLPGMDTIFSGPLANIALAAGGAPGGPLNLVAGIGELQLGNCLANSADLSKIQAVTQEFQKGTGWVSEFGKVLMNIFWVLPYLAESVRNDLECFQQQANMHNPVQLLGLGAIVKAYYRGVLSSDSANTEAKKLGLSSDRLQALKEIELWLPGPELAVRMFYRGIISQDELLTVLTKQALSGDDVKALQEVALDPVNAREAMQVFWRQQAGQANWLGGSLNSPPPGVLTDLYPPRGMRPEQATWDWLANWKIPELEWWFTAWTRGLRTEEEFRLAAQAERIPQEVIPDLLSIFQEPIQLWMIPDMLGAGILSEEEAQQYLHYIGMDDASTKIIMRYGATKAKAPVAAQAANLGAISAAVAKTMFTDGVIDAATYTEILSEHGYSAQAAQLTVALAQQEAALAARKSKVSDIVAEVDAGTITEADAVTSMYSMGYTAAEVDVAVGKMKSGKAAKAKIPTQAEFDAFRKNGIIDQAAWTAGYAALGYSTQWIQAFEAQWEVKYGGPTNTGGVGAGGETDGGASSVVAAGEPAST